MSLLDPGVTFFIGLGWGGFLGALSVVTLILTLMRPDPKKKE